MSLILSREIIMHTKAQLAVADVLMACRALNDFGNQAMAILKHGVPYPLDDKERVELKQAIQLLRRTLDSVDPFIFDTIQQVNKSAKKPNLRLV
ncbi:hypothetical protein EY04_27470 [Pseudomonas chlororaphis]|uniref:hypothetical protein n=1 Tax=Pseudomonas chlororaphis TaxID=587753 RepID=UPI0004AC0D95|nr:hypothetical protein [Pseudomonas chlororaphis]AIC22524.1 hypothetical protein EY04_27470 [Pseudomonas chlororaphis]